MSSSSLLLPPVLGNPSFRLRTEPLASTVSRHACGSRQSTYLTVIMPVRWARAQLAEEEKRLRWGAVRGHGERRSGQVLGGEKGSGYAPPRISPPRLPTPPPRKPQSLTSLPRGNSFLPAFRCAFQAHIQFEGISSPRHDTTTHTCNQLRIHT